MYLLLKLQGNEIHEEDLDRQQYTGCPTLVERSSKEGTCATPVHWCTSHIEWESLHFLIHQDSEVVTEICTCDAKRVHGGQYEDIANPKEDGTEYWEVEWWV